MDDPLVTLIHQRVALARQGRNRTVIRRMPSGWAVMGDHQFLAGYSLLVPDPVVGELTDLHGDARTRFLLDMSLLGEAVLAATGAHRMNYEILGNTDPALHAHIWPRFAHEPDEFRRGPVGRYPSAQRRSVDFSPSVHGPLQAAIGSHLDALLEAGSSIR